MGRGRGGYTEKQTGYKDSGGHKVSDTGAIWIAERYIDMGYESVFRQQHPERGKQFDLTIKTADDRTPVKNIEVKKVTTLNTSNIAKNIKTASKQISIGDTVALYMEGRMNTADNRSFVSKGIDEARRKGYIKGPVEVWFSDKTRITY